VHRRCCFQQTWLLAVVCQPDLPANELQLCTAHLRIHPQHSVRHTAPNSAHTSMDSTAPDDRRQPVRRRTARLRLIAVRRLAQRAEPLAAAAAPAMRMPEWPAAADALQERRRAAAPRAASSRSSQHSVLHHSTCTWKLRNAPCPGSSADRRRTWGLGTKERNIGKHLEVCIRVVAHVLLLSRDLSRLPRQLTKQPSVRASNLHARTIHLRAGTPGACRWLHLGQRQCSASGTRPMPRFRRSQHRKTGMQTSRLPPAPRPGPCLLPHARLLPHPSVCHTVLLHSGVAA